MQGETLDNIEKGMAQASSSTDSAVRELRVTQQRQYSLRCYLCILLMSLMMAALWMEARV